MARIGEWFRRILYLLNRGRVEATLEEEMIAHRAMMGEPARFGNTLQLRERARDVWGWNWLDGLVRDLRFAARGLRRTPVFTLVVTLSLALGFALTATVVSVVNAYLVRSLPYPAVDRLYHLRYAPPGPWEPRGMTGLDWTSVQDVVEYPDRLGGRVVLSGRRRLCDGVARIAGVAGLHRWPGRLGRRRAAAVGSRFRRRRRAGRAHRSRALAGSVCCESGGDRAAAARRIGVPSRHRGELPHRRRPRPDFYFGRDTRTAVDLLVAQPAPIRTYMVRLREGIPPAAAERGSPTRRGEPPHRRFPATGAACSSSRHASGGLAR